jgi:hypothetical protein
MSWPLSSRPRRGTGLPSIPQAAGLETPNPMGKMLLVDQILLLAANFKPADYHPATADVRRFLCAALKAMGRTTLTIDLVAYKL